MDVEGVGHVGDGAQGNHRYLTFCLTPTKFHAVRFVSLEPKANRIFITWVNSGFP